MAQVTMQFFANAQQAQAAINRLQQQYAQLQHQISHLNQTSQTGGAAGSSALARWANRAVGVATGFVSIERIVSKVIELNREWITQADEAELKYSKLFTRWRTIAGGTAGQTAEARKKIGGEAIRAAVPVEFAEALSEEMVGEGFGPKEATGGSLRAALELVKGTGSDGDDPREIARAIAMYLNAQGLEKSAANTRKLAMAIQRLYKKTSLKLQDFVSFAGKTELAWGAMSMEEQIATFTIMRQKNPGDVAATAFKIFVDRIQTIKARPADTAALKRIGLRPEDVDLVGEDVQTVLARLQEGLDTVPENIQNIVLSQLFEERSRSPVQGLIRDRGLIPGLIGMMGDARGYDEDIGVATSGKAAARTRHEALEETRWAERDTGTIDLMNAADELLEERGVPWIPRVLTRWSAMFASMLGASDDAALRMYGGGMGVDVEEIRGRKAALESSALSKEGIDLLRQANEYLKTIANEKSRGRREGVGAP